MPIFKIAMFGVQGAGKGTQARLISQEYHIPVIAPGDIFREEIRKGTELGKKVAEYIDKGQLAPNEITNQIVLTKLQSPECQKGFILDGYPRNLSQVGALNRFIELTHVFNIKISDQEAITRMSGRRICPQCGRIYHLKFDPPKKDEICDECGAKLYQRVDDTPEAIQERLKIYHQETEPILDFYRAKKILYDINGEQDIKKVFQDIKIILEQYDSSQK